MTEPYYYVKKDPATDLTLINAVAAAIETWKSSAGNSPSGEITRSLRIAGKAGVGSQVIEDFLDITINGVNSSATIAGFVVDLALEGAAEKLTEQIILCACH